MTIWLGILIVYNHQIANDMALIKALERLKVLEFQCFQAFIMGFNPYYWCITMFLLCFFMYLIENWLDTIYCGWASASAPIYCAWVHRIANFFPACPDPALSSGKNAIFEKSVEYLTMSLFSQKYSFWNCVWQSITDRGFCRRYSEPALQIRVCGVHLTERRLKWHLLW